MCLKVVIRLLVTRPPGSRQAIRPALLNAVLSTVHAGGEQGWELDHLEPFSFCAPQLDRRPPLVPVGPRLEVPPDRQQHVFREGRADHLKRDWQIPRHATRQHESR
jgi:hypothetical protein